MDWDAWCARNLAEEDIVRLILDGTVIRTRLDKKPTNISVLAAIGVAATARDPAVHQEHGRREHLGLAPDLDDLDARGLKRPDFVIVDGAPGSRPRSPRSGPRICRSSAAPCTSTESPGHAPRHLHDELTEDYRDMIYAETAAAGETRRKAFLRNGT